MRILKQVFKFYLESSIHVALAVCALVLVSSFNFGLSIDWNLLFFVFFATISAYNFVKYAGLARLHHKSLATHLKAVQIFSFACFLALLFFTFFQPARVLWVCFFLAVLTILYAVPFLPNKTNLRNLKSLKIIIIASVWAGVGALLPWQNWSQVFQPKVFWLFLQYFLFIVSTTLPFEIRDLNYDKLSLGTIPQRIGVLKTKILGIIFLFLVILLQFLAFDQSWISNLSLVTVCFFAGVLLVFSSVKQKKCYASFWVEALPVFWLLLLNLLR